jgi:WD40 repeat protein
MLNALFAHPISGTTPVLSTASSMPAQATILTRPLYIYREHLGTVTAVAWSSNGQYIASVGALDNSVQVWNANTGNLTLIPLFPKKNQRVDAVAWSPDSKDIAASMGDETVDIWSIATGHPIHIPFSQPGNVSQSWDANALAWSPDGGRIAAVSGNSIVQVRMATTGILISMYTGHKQAVLTLAWSPNGKFIASGSADSMVKVWNVTTGSTSVTYSLHTAEVNAVALAESQSTLTLNIADSARQCNQSHGLPMAGISLAVVWKEPCRCGTPDCDRS